MKKQQINLYKSLPHISRNWFGEMVVLQIAAGFVALLILVTVIQAMMLQWSGYQAGRMEKKYVETNALFAKEEKAEGGIDLVQLQQELASKTQLISLLHIKTAEEGACPLLSNYFQSFSDVQTAGLWLTRFRIEPDTGNLILEGETYDPLLIISWVRQLGTTPCFSDVRFHTIDVEKSSDPAGNTMTFSLTSTVAPVKAGGSK